ncbi:MAG: hypothetical protein ACRD2L_05730 [Terriglobia bacterium]
MKKGSVKLWTRQEEAFLQQYYPLKGSSFVAEKLERTRASVLRHAFGLGIDGRRSLPYRPFSTREIISLKTYYPLHGSEYVAEKLGRTPSAIRRKAQALRVERKSTLLWHSEEIEYLRQWYNKKRPSHIARRLGRTTLAVCVRARMLGLCRHCVRTWTEAEEKFLRENYRTMRYRQIAERLGRTVGSVTGKLHVGLKLKKWSKHRWTAADKRRLAYWYGKHPTRLVAAKLGVTREAARRMAHYRGLTERLAPAYTEREKDFLREDFLTMSNRELAERLNRSVGSIELMGKKLGLTGNPLKVLSGYASRGRKGKPRK